MCKGCKHETACKSLDVADFIPQPSPCFEPEGLTSKLDPLRTQVASLPAVLRFAEKPAPVPAAH